VRRMGSWRRAFLIKVVPSGGRSRPLSQACGLFLLMVCSLWGGLAGCSLPEGDQSSPTQLHYKWVKVRAAGDIEQMWQLLHPDIRNEFERWLTAERLLLNEIKTAYPKEDAAAALEAIGGSARGELESPKALFKLFVRPSPEPPGTLGEVSAHVRSEDIAADGMTATIRTYGGDEVSFKKGSDGNWYTTLASDEAVRLSNARNRAEQNLKRVKSNLQKLGRNQP